MVVNRTSRRKRSCTESLNTDVLNPQILVLQLNGGTWEKAYCADTVHLQKCIHTSDRPSIGHRERRKSALTRAAAPALACPPPTPTTESQAKMRSRARHSLRRLPLSTLYGRVRRVVCCSRVRELIGTGLVTESQSVANSALPPLRVPKQNSVHRQ